MTGNTLYILIGVTIIAVLGGAVAWVRWRRDPQSGAGNKIHPLLLLGIVFLIPGLMILIQDGELSGFLNLGILFTLTGLAAQVLIKPQEDPQVRKVILLSTLVGVLLGGVSGSVISTIVEWSFPLTLVLFCTLGLLLGMLFGKLYLRSNKL